MTYYFDKDYVEVLNHLVFDADLDSDAYHNITLKDSSFELRIQRLMFENVRRTKFLFFKLTHIKALESIIRFQDVEYVHIEHIKKIETEDCSVLRFEIINPFQITLKISIGPSLTVKFKNEISLSLTDVSTGERENSTLLGTYGFTQDEWEQYLIKEQYAT